METAIAIMIVLSWPVVGIASLIYDWTREFSDMTLGDLAVQITCGVVLGWFAFIIFVVCRGLGEKVVWRRKPKRD